MTQLNRRSILSSFLAIPAISLVPDPVLAVFKKPSVTDALVKRIRNNENIIGEQFILDKGIVIDFYSTSLISDCYFECADDFPVGQTVIDLCRSPKDTKIHFHDITVTRNQRSGTSMYAAYIAT